MQKAAYTPCPDKKFLRYFQYIFGKFKHIFIIFGTSCREDPFY